MIRIVLAIAMLSPLAFGQASRYDNFAWTIGTPSSGSSSGGGTPVSINSLVITGPNFNNSSPPPLSGYASVLWQASGSNVSGQVAPATSSLFGVVKPDNSTITISGGVISATTSGGSAGGSNQQMQFNNSSAFGGDADFTYNSGTHVHALGSSGILDLHLAATGGLKLPGGFSTGILGVTTSTGAVSSTAGTQGQLVAYGSGGAPQAVPDVVFNAYAMGLTLNNSTNDCTALSSALTTITSAGGGYLYFPATPLLSTCDIVLPDKVGLMGTGISGSDIDGILPLPPSYLHMTHSGSGHIQALGTTGSPGLITRGRLTNLAIVDNVSPSPCIVATGMTLDIDNVSCQGSASGTSAVNPGIIFGSTTGTCVPGSLSSNFCGYYTTVNNFHCSQCSTIMSFMNAANGIYVNGVFGDATDGNLSGYAVDFNGTISGQGPYGNNVKNIEIEQSTTGGSQRYKGAVGFGDGSGGYSSLNIVEINANDPGPATHGAWVLSANSTGNKITCQSIGFGYTNTQCVSDVSSSVPNPIEDLYLEATFWRFGNFPHIGWQKPTNDMIWGMGSIASLPTPVTGMTRWVNDSSTGDCSTNGGSTDVFCFYNGSAWKPLGEASSPHLAFPDVGAATGISLALTTDLQLAAKTFATLDSSPVDGEIQYCSDCKMTTPASCPATGASCICTGSGGGAFAKRMNFNAGGDNWYCQ